RVAEQARRARARRARSACRGAERAAERSAGRAIAHSTYSSLAARNWTARVKTSLKDREAKVIALARVGSSPEACRGPLAANSLGDDPVATCMRLVVRDAAVRD